MRPGSEPVLQVAVGVTRARRFLDPAPPSGAGDGRVRRLTWPGSGRRQGAAATRRVAHAILAHGRAWQRRPILVLTGALGDQARFLLDVLERPALRARVHLTLCVGQVRQPLPLPPGELFGRADAVVTTTPHARDTVARHLSAAGVAHGPRLSVIGPGFPLQALATRAEMRAHRAQLGIGSRTRVIAAPFARASQWSALAFEIFKIWSEGLYRDCRRCRARVLPALRADTAALTPANACPHCGGRDLVAGVRRRGWLLLQHELDAEPGDPDPEVLAEWLPPVNARVLRAGGVPGPARAPAWSRTLALADVALLPADNVFADPLVAASLACATPCITTGFGCSGAGGLIRLPSRAYSWDVHNHLAAYPDPIAATRVLDALADEPSRLTALREQAAASRSALDEEHIRGAWQCLFDAELQRARRLPRAPRRFTRLPEP